MNYWYCYCHNNNMGPIPTPQKNNSTRVHINECYDIVHWEKAFLMTTGKNLHTPLLWSAVKPDDGKQIAKKAALCDSTCSSHVTSLPNTDTHWSKYHPRHCYPDASQYKEQYVILRHSSSSHNHDAVRLWKATTDGDFYLLPIRETERIGGWN